jgi:nitrogen regulatory protein PII-like uncharacterized protein
MRSSKGSYSAQVIASVANPGVGRHFRVQYRDTAHDDWRMYAVFRRRDQAEACLGMLHQRGVTSRLLDCDRCPTAL